MGFLEHLDELRTRLIRSCLAIGVGMLVAFFFVDRIADFVLAPTLRMLPAGAIDSTARQLFSWRMTSSAAGNAIASGSRWERVSRRCSS